MTDRQTGWARAAADIEHAERLRHEARGLMSGGKHDLAEMRLREAIALDPASINFELLGECLLALGKPKDAVLYLAAGTGLGHNQFKTRVKLAEALYGLGPSFVHDALWQLEEALRVNPSYGLARQLLQAWLRQDPALRDHLRPDTAGRE